MARVGRRTLEPSLVLSALAGDAIVLKKKRSFQRNTKVLRQLFLGNGSVQKQSFPGGQGDSSGPPFPNHCDSKHHADSVLGFGEVSA